MESANLQHQLQELFSGYSSLASAPRTPSINPSIFLDGSNYNPYLESENPWFNFSSTHQANEQLQISTLYSSDLSPASYGGFQLQGMAAGSNTNVYNHVFPSSRNNGGSSTLDLLSSSSFSNSMGYSSLPTDPHLNFPAPAANYSGGFQKTGVLFGYGNQHDVQDSVHSPSNSSNNPPSVARAKRPGNSSCSIAKKSISETKKSCSTPRSSCPPLKVRKEKLGDRISALQRLVAPFGKTDTSSVLTEAIGYIQFLHDQVETLSMPYLKSSPSKPYQKLQSVSTEEDGTRPRRDLGSRGLCLMPLSCATFIHGCD